MCHVPYNEAVLPFPIHLTRCAICRSVIITVLIIITFIAATITVVNGHFMHEPCLQCFDAVSWASGRASGL